MTGRELIIFILLNGLEDELMVDEIELLHEICMSLEEAAVKFGVGVPTVKVWVDNDIIPKICFNGEIYILKNTPNPMEQVEGGKNV